LKAEPLAALFSGAAKQVGFPLIDIVDAESPAGPSAFSQSRLSLRENKAERTQGAYCEIDH
jgi:hypothetical protein